MTSLKRHSLRVVALFLFANNFWQRYHKHETKKKPKQVRKKILKVRQKIVRERKIEWTSNDIIAEHGIGTKSMQNNIFNKFEKRKHNNTHQNHSNI